VTSLRPALERIGTRRDPRAAVLTLTDAHRPALDRLVGSAPIVNAVAAARLSAARSLRAPRLGATALGVAAGGSLSAAAFHGANLLPIGGDPDSWAALADHLGAGRRVCTSIVGPSDAVAAMWSRLQTHWGPARELRNAQPLLVRDTVAGLTDDERLRPLEPDELEAYLPAAAAMFAEELGVVPDVSAASGYRRRAEHLLATGRAFGITGRGGAVLFKADIGALTSHTCQIQGVWVRPELRGRGLGRIGMAAVLVRALRLAPTVSLYVNDFNVVARNLYTSLGMRQSAELATVLF
jgi:predicted GNAT family acetyltransferase